MNKCANLCIILLSLFLFSFTDGTRKKTDWEKDELKGRVKSVHTFYYEKSDEKTLAINPLTLSKNDTTKHFISDYDVNGNITSYKTNTDLVLLVSNYDSTANVIISAKYNFNDKLVYEDTTMLDNNGNRIEQITKGYEPSPYNFRASYNVDAKGNELEMDAYSNQKFLYKWVYKYDEKGNRIEDVQFYLLDSFLQKLVYQYDENRNMTEMALFKDSLIERTTFKYNKQGSIIEEAKYGPDDKLIETRSYKYDYDDKGNWIRKINLNKKQQPAVTIRVIEYY